MDPHSKHNRISPVSPVFDAHQESAYEEELWRRWGGASAPRYGSSGSRSIAQRPSPQQRSGSRPVASSQRRLPRPLLPGRRPPRGGSLVIRQSIASGSGGRDREFFRWVQSALSHALGITLPVTGIMDNRTRAAVRDFQRQQGLPADGIVGPDTERALMAARRGQGPGTAAAMAAQPAEPADPSSAGDDRADSEVLDLYLERRQGERESGTVNRRSRDYVRWVQRSLNQMLGLRLAEDGLMGPQTRSAIRRFQQSRGLTVDGVVGPRTEAALLEAGAPGLPGTTVINLPPVVITGLPCDRVDRFDFDSDRLKPAHLNRISALAKRIVDSQATARPVRTVFVTGHTDSVGSADYNQGLGQRRALAVRRELLSALDRARLGMSTRVLVLARSSGEREPVSGNAAENRRVEICLSTKALRPPRPVGPQPTPPRPTPPAPPRQPAPLPPSCDRQEYARRVDRCVEDARRCVIDAHKRLGMDLMRCRGNALCNTRATAKYYLALRRCRDAIMPCDQMARRATNC